MTTHPDHFNYLFQTKLNGWTPLSAPLHRYFNDEEIALLVRSNRSFSSADRTVVVLSFENRFASFGGLGAVVRQLPAALRKQCREKVLMLTPLHRGCAAVRAAIDSGELVPRFSGHAVRICNVVFEVECFEEAGAPVPTLHVGIGGRFFAGDNPYGYHDNRELLTDALAFCAVVPSVCARTGTSSHVLFHAHDWETAPIAIFARFAVISSLLQQAQTVLTLHNSFDAPFPDDLQERFFGRSFGIPTVLLCMLPLVNGPLTTVSTPFAHELRYDPLQRGYFVDHLQQSFSANPPVGIENGMFGEPEVPFSPDEVVCAVRGDFRPVLMRKESWRTAFLEAAVRETDQRIIGMFSRRLITRPEIPVFFMSGRLDPMQKGFDVVFNAFDRIGPGRALLFFAPTLHSEADDLSFYRDIANKCKGSIVIWPFRLSSQRYRTFLQGASFLLMPSLYEPFGAASEGFLHGTPVVARASGGLLSQIQGGEKFTLPAHYAALFPSSCSGARNGILFKEAIPDEEAKFLWRGLLELPLERRTENPLYRSMVDAAYGALCEAIEVFGDNPAYGAMIQHGLTSVQRSSWAEAAKKYSAVYDAAISRGV